jgi:LysM repeat protein
MLKKTPSRRIPGIAFVIYLLAVLSAGLCLGWLLYRAYANLKPSGYASSGEVTEPAITSAVPNSTSTPTATSTQTAAVQTTPSATLTPETSLTLGATSYTVQAGDTLSGIAEKFGVSVEALREANGIKGDLIHPGDQLIIPAASLPPTASDAQYQVLAQDTVDSIATALGISADDLRAANFMYGDALLPGQKLIIPHTTPVQLPPFHFSTFEGSLEAAYPLSLRTERFTLHYTPQTFPAIDPQAVASLVEGDAARIEALFKINLNEHFDVFVMGSPFDEPNSQLRGISFSSPLRSFFLDDGSGNATDLQYINTHEMTHIFAWNAFGPPHSNMLSEGTAVYAGMTGIAGSDYIPLDVFCAIYRRAGQLPNVSGPLSLVGHIYDLPNYYASGCFVGYLVRVYGVESLGKVYSSGDFAMVYGKSMQVLEQDWRASIDLAQIPVDFDGDRLISAVQTIGASYRSFISNFSGTSVQLKAYRELDLARLDMLCGRLDEMDLHLKYFHQILNNQ